MKTDVKPPSLLIIDRVFHLEDFALFQHVIHRNRNCVFIELVAITDINFSLLLNFWI